MENASKALLMAGALLISIMVISIAVYLYINFAGTGRQIYRNIESNQISQFNSQFTSYEGRTDVTIHDVIDMASLASQNNISYEFPKRDPAQNTGIDNYITVILDTRAIEYGYIENGNQDAQKTNISNMQVDYNNKIKNELDLITATSPELPTYNVKIEISGTTQRVYKVTCTKNSP